ncbi:unnamed protein product [Closterium sp. NIES-64]|nr:unnamed protein product [Closterium sp. NIES-64]
MPPRARRGGASRKSPASASARGKASPAAAASPASQRGLSDSPSIAEVPIATSPLALPGKSPAKSPGGPAAVDGSPGQTGRQLRSQKPGESPSLPNGGSPKSRGRKRGSSDGEMDAKRRRSGEKGKGGKAAAAAAAKAVASPAARKAGKAGKAGKEGEAGKGGEEGVAEETVKLEKADEAAEREDEGDADEEQGGSGEESPTGEEQQRRGARRARGEGRGGAGGASRGAGARGRGRGARGRGGKAGAGLVSPDRPMSPGGAAGAGKGRGPRKRSPAPPIHADGETGGAGKGGRGGGGAGVAGAAGGAGRGGEELQDVVHEAGAAGSGIVRDEKALDSVVKVFCVHTDPNFSLPWQRKRQYSSNSSGFIIENRRVLTNAHSVEHHTQVKVKKRGSDTKYLATVLAVGTECDIALLSVEDDEFWKDVQPLKLGSLPHLQDPVTVVGYPIGGDTISVTSGVVSRIEVTAYVHGASELLGVQIDAAINSGNSGGPAFNAAGECVGIAFQSMRGDEAENIGYIIPTPVIHHFISDYDRNGHYTGFPILGVEWQKMENPDMRKALGMEAGQKGVRVRRVEPTSPAAQLLQTSDILLSFDGVAVANDGTVPFRKGERIGFSYLVSQKYEGETAQINVLRGGKVLQLQVELRRHKRMVPVHIAGLPPSYFIVAGIVFTWVTVPYLRAEYGKDYDYDAPVKLLDKLMHRMRQSDDEQVVVISQVLVADVNIGYEEVVNTQVVGFNGVPVKNLLQLARLVDQCTDPFMQFDLDYDQVLVLETAKAKDATPDILAIHSIPSHCSSDIKEGHLSTIVPFPLFPDNSFSSQQWEEAYGLQKESLLPPEKISLPADVAAAPHLEACSEVSAHRLAAEQRGPNGESPEWARPKDCCGCNPQPPWVCMGGYDWIRGSDAANLGMTRVAQRDIWEHQFPPNRCEGRRLLIAHWAYIAHGIGSQPRHASQPPTSLTFLPPLVPFASVPLSPPPFVFSIQLHIITAILSLAMRHNRTLVLQYPSFDRAKHDECNATGAWGSFNCYFFPLTSPDCEEIALNSNSTGALPPCCTPSTKEEVLASDHPIVCFHGEPFNGLQFEASIASQWDTAYLERPNMIELQGQVERDNPQHIKVHWWRSQALRFMLRWPSPYLCHLTNRIRHGAYGLRVATHTVQARDRSAALLRLYNDHLSAASPSSLPASASSTSLHPLSLNHSDPSFLSSADPSMQSRAWPGLGVASCSGSASSPGPAPSFRAYLTSLYEGVGREAYMPRPMVSLHIRQGDKGSEMKLSSFNSFMFYMHRLRLHVPDIRFVWISTEMQSVIDQSAQFKDWTFFYSQNERQLGDMRLIDYEKKAGRAQLVGVSFANLIISSECDYYVGVLGSNWNRLINEMRATSGRVFAGYVAINNGEF